MHRPARMADFTYCKVYLQVLKRLCKCFLCKALVRGALAVLCGVAFVSNAFRGEDRVRIRLGCTKEGGGPYTDVLYTHYDYAGLSKKIRIPVETHVRLEHVECGMCVCCNTGCVEGVRTTESGMGVTLAFCVGSTVAYTPLPTHYRRLTWTWNPPFIGATIVWV